MPLTIAHTVAILPLRRWFIAVSALVTGSIAPDMEYIFHQTPGGEIGHSVEGLVIFCLPAGLLLLVAYQRLWKPAALSMMPAVSFPRARRPFHFLPAGRLALICLAVLIGAMTHQLWDSATHQGGWVVERVPALERTVYEGYQIQLRGYMLAQHMSTLFGLMVLAALAVRNREGFRAVPGRVWRLAAAIFALSAAGGIIFGLYRTGIPGQPAEVLDFLGFGTVTLLVLVMVLTTMTSLVVMRRNRRGKIGAD